MGVAVGTLARIDASTGPIVGWAAAVAIALATTTRPRKDIKRSCLLITLANDGAATIDFTFFCERGAKSYV